MRFVYEALLVAAAVAPLVLLALWTTRPRAAAPAALFLALLALDTLLTPLPYALGLHPAGLQWNWIGKVLSIAWALVFLRVGPITAEEAGLTLRQRPGSVVPAAVLTVLLIGATAVLSGSDGRATTETLLYQATMPGLAEELAVRGVFLALLHRAFSGVPLRLQGAALPAAEPARGAARAWPILITATAFGLWHGLGIREGAVFFQPMSFALPFIGGLAFAWLRERTGSLLFPVLAHNGANLIGFLLPG
jgi:membrane protease YdiL (CAAX protease family)